MDEQVQGLEDQLALAAEEMREELEKLEAVRRERLSALAGQLEVKAKDVISKRAAVETRWLEDLRQFHGYYGYISTKEEPFVDQFSRVQRPKVNITRDKCTTAIGHMGDLQFPGRDKNFNISATPKPDLERAVSSMAQAPGQPEGVTEGQLAADELKRAAMAAKKMENTIWDQLEDARWGPESRDAIRDLVILGTAVMKGPTVEGKVRKRWKKDVNKDGVMVHMCDYETEKRPSIKRVDPWYFFPDMQATCPKECEYAFELHPLNKKELAKLAKHPYFDTEEIADLVDEEPDDIITTDISNRHSITGADLYYKNRYQVFEYHGPIDDKVIEAMGMEDRDRRNPLTGYVGEVWFCQGHILKVQLSSLEGDDGIPYAFTQWEQDETNPFGFGIPFLVRDAQRVVNSTWRMILDNSGLAAGPQVVVNKEMIEPANGKWDIEPMKVWYVTEYGNNPEEAMSFFNVPSAADELSAVMQMAMRFAESEASMPMVAQNERESYGTTTATGLSLLVNESNVVQKRANKNWDDHITTVLIDRFYTWNMLYNPDSEIKGDYDVVARGSTDLMSRQMETQDAATLLQASAQNPAFAQVVDQTALAKLVIASMHIPADLVVKTDEQIAAEQEAAAQNEKPDPEVMKIEIEMAKLEEAKLKREMDFEIKQMDMQIKAQKVENELQTFIAMSQAQVISEQNEREQKIMELAHKSDMTAKQLLAEVGMKQKSEETMKLIEATNAAIKLKDIQARIDNMNAKAEGKFDSFG